MEKEPINAGIDICDKGIATCKQIENSLAELMLQMAGVINDFMAEIEKITDKNKEK